MMTTDTPPRRSDHEAHRAREPAAEADRAPPKPADDSERLVDIICAMMAERSAAGA